MSRLKDINAAINAGFADFAGEMAAAQENARAVQIGGDHYRKLAIQPFDYITANGLGYAEGNVVKYISRWQSKNGLQDLRKARHYIDLLIERETGNG